MGDGRKRWTAKGQWDETLNSVVDEVPINQMRWYYSSKLKPMSGYDTLAVEAALRERKKKPGDPFPKVAVLKSSYEVSESEENGQKRYSLIPLYATGEPIPLTRGLWFVDDDICAPLADASSEFVLRIERLYKWKFGFGDGDRKPQSFVINGKEVKFNGPFNVEVKEAGIFRSTWTPIRRGYKEEANKNDGSPTVDNLVFVVGGIGQMHFDSNKANTEELRDNVNRTLMASYKSLKNHPLFVPIDWRSSFKVNGELIDRVMMHSTGAAMTFIQDWYKAFLLLVGANGARVRDHLKLMLQQAYDDYLQRDPDFTHRRGKVSIVGHSLGGVLALQTLTADFAEDPAARVSGLTFSVTNVFGLGSPIGRFAAMRCEKSFAWQMLQEKFKYHNMFFPDDPVASQIDPLVCDASSLPEAPLVLEGVSTTRVMKMSTTMENARPRAPVDVQLPVESNAILSYLMPYRPHFGYWGSRAVSKYMCKTFYGEPEN